MHRPDRSTVLGTAVGFAVAVCLLAVTYGIYTVLSIHSIAMATHTLLTDGKTASALTAKQGLIASKTGARDIAQAEKLLNTNHSVSTALACQVLTDLHDSSLIYRKNCGAVIP